ncbi:MAG TPA: hypothetical protein VJ372_04315 [Pyrinomonadaceae bacterium]|nr:hypothetical protein [Pyrinomonadaceae bacterium]
MSLLENLHRANEIIEDRTPAEERYDREVVRWMRKGKATIIWLTWSLITSTWPSMS